jgi:hypothetical protein
VLIAGRSDQLANRKLEKPHSLSLHDITRTACRPSAATETDDLDSVFTAAVGDGFNDRVEAWDVAATSEDAYSLFHNSTP